MAHLRETELEGTNLGQSNATGGVGLVTFPGLIMEISNTYWVAD